MRYSLMLLAVFTVLSCGKQPQDEKAAKRNTIDGSGNRVEKTEGIVLCNHPLTVRFTDNSERFIHINDKTTPGMNGIASLIHADQGKNIFTTVGMNLECTHTYPPAGKHKTVWNAPRVGFMKMEQIDSFSVKYSQKASEVAGLNIEMLFTLENSCIDQTITTWPDHDIDSSSSFWASYMNQVQNTSIFLRTTGKKNEQKQWREITSAGHNAMDGVGVFGRSYDPFGLEWDEHLRENPLLRQSVFETAESRQATLDAGFLPYLSKRMDRFYYGLVDDYVYLMIFKESNFIFWISASGGSTLCQPAWDYEFKTGAQKAGEKRTFHVRLVYKPFKGIDDVLDEVEKFLNIPVR